MSPIHWLLVLPILAAAWIPTAASLDFEFVWDDRLVVGPVLDTQGPADWLRLGATPLDSLLVQPPPDAPRYFRPVSLWTLAVDRALYADAPRGYHASNLFWYGVACVLLWLFVAELTGRPVAAAAGALVFALHPAHAESVCWVLGRTDLAAGVFVFAALWAAARFAARAARPGGTVDAALVLAPAALLLLPGLLAKEVAVCAAPLLLLVAWLRVPELGGRSLVLASLPVLVVLAVYGALRVAVVGLGVSPDAGSAPSVLAAIVTSAGVFARYLGLLLVPLGLSARHDLPVVAEPDALFLAGAATLLGLAFALGLALRRRSAWSVPVALLLCTLAPQSIVGLVAGAPMADRLLFVPSASLAVAIALLPPIAGGLAAAAFAALFVSLLPARVALWQSQETLFQSVLRDSGESAYVHGVLGVLYQREGQPERAAQHQRRSLELAPQVLETRLYLAEVEAELGRFDEARKNAMTATRSAPGDPRAWHTLGNVELRSGDAHAAVQAYERALAIAPQLAATHSNLAEALERAGYPQRAREHRARAAAPE